MSKSTRGDIFTKFAFLPKELRLKIWNFALAPSVVSFHRDLDRGRYVGSQPRKFLALTALSPSHEIIPHTCAESLAVSKKRYIEWEVWDIRKNVSTIKFDPEHDVVYFSHEFNKNIDHQILLDFAGHSSSPAQQIRILALPAGFFSGAKEGMDVLRALRAFKNLKELIVVLGYTLNQESCSTGTSSLRGYEFSRSAVSHEASDHGHRDWVIPDGIANALKHLKRDYWPDWKIPQVMIAKYLNDVLRVWGAEVKQ